MNQTILNLRKKICNLEAIEVELSKIHSPKQRMKIRSSARKDVLFRAQTAKSKTELMAGSRYDADTGEYDFLKSPKSRV